jgi:hypothetical protein
VPGCPPLLCASSCACHANSAQQIQLLRLIHAYIDRDTDDARDRWVTRRRVLCAAEEASLLKLDLVSGVPDVRTVVGQVVGRFVAARAASGPTSGSIMAQLVQLLVTSSFSSPYRFWLSSCIETFLRCVRGAAWRRARCLGVLWGGLEEVVHPGVDIACNCVRCLVRLRVLVRVAPTADPPWAHGGGSPTLA